MQNRSHRYAGLAAVTVLLVFMAAGVSWANGEDEDGDITVTGVHERQQFAAGAQVRVHDATLTDAFVAGGEVAFDRITAEDVYAAGGSLRFHSSRINDLVIAGGEVVIDASIEDDLVAAGGRIRLQSGATVGGDVVLAGGDVDLGGRIDGNVTATGGRVTVSGMIGGDLEVAAAELVIRPDARIAGRLIYQSEDDPHIADSAIISGGVERRDSTAPSFSAWAGVGVGIAIALVITLGLMLLAAVLQSLIPSVLGACAEFTSQRLLASWLLGFAVLVAVPVAANVALVTLVGAPLAVVLHLTYALTLALALVVVAHWIGGRVMQRWRKSLPGPSNRQRITWTALGMLLLVLISLVPLLGWLVLLAVIPAGVGSVVAQGAGWVKQHAATASLGACG